jgi:hypothetical protein
MIPEMSVLQVCTVVFLRAGRDRCTEREEERQRRRRREGEEGSGRVAADQNSKKEGGEKT